MLETVFTLALLRKTRRSLFNILLNPRLVKSLSCGLVGASHDLALTLSITTFLGNGLQLQQASQILCYFSLMLVFFSCLFGLGVF